MLCVFVTVDVKVDVLINREDSINTILLWIVFQTDNQRESIYENSINFFSDISMFTEKYRPFLLTEFGGNT